MTDKIVLENKISVIKKYLTIVDGYKKYSQSEIENSIELRGAVERYLYLAVQSAIDLADALVSYKNLRKPASMSESFDILNEEGIIPNDLTEKMVKMTGFRNIIAHDYEKINYGIVYDVLNSGVKDIEEFAGVVEKL